MDKEEYEQQVLLNSAKLKDYTRRITTSKQDAEDLAQDTLYLALRNRDKYREQHSMEAWLLSIACNIRKNDLRRGRKVTTQARMKELATIQHHEETYECLSRIPEDQRETFLMLLKGYSYKEIAYQLAVPIGTIKSRIHTARARLLKIVNG